LPLEPGSDVRTIASAPIGDADLVLGALVEIVQVPVSRASRRADPARCQPLVKVPLLSS
jgi:hypothetical protein